MMNWRRRPWIPAITLTQPWATLVALGAKKFETRSWRTDYHGPLAIHAAKGLGAVGGMRGLKQIVQWEEPFCTVLCDAGITDARALPLGAVVAVVNLVDVYPTLYSPDGHRAVLREHGAERVTGNEADFGDYNIGRHAWDLRDVERLAEPVPVKGALGLWPWEISPAVRGVELLTRS